jgi:hypothetical protein
MGEGACVRVTRYNIVMKTAAAARALRNVSMLGELAGKPSAKSKMKKRSSDSSIAFVVR